MTDRDRVLCGLTAKHGSPGRPRQGFPEGSAVLRLCPGSWFREEREGEQGAERGPKGQNREASCGGSSKRPLGIWAGRWPSLSGIEEGRVGHIAVWKEGSLTSTLTHTPTPAGMAAICQRVVSLGQVPHAETSEMPQGSQVRDNFSPGNIWDGSVYATAPVCKQKGASSYSEHHTSPHQALKAPSFPAHWPMTAPSPIIRSPHRKP